MPAESGDLLERMGWVRQAGTKEWENSTGYLYRGTDMRQRVGIEAGVTEAGNAVNLLFFIWHAM